MYQVTIAGYAVFIDKNPERYEGFGEFIPGKEVILHNGEKGVVAGFGKDPDNGTEQFWFHASSGQVGYYRDIKTPEEFRAVGVKAAE